MNQQQILDEFWALKFKAQVTFPIYNDIGDYIGNFTPLSVNYINYDIARQFAVWRNNNMDSFLTHFNATPERTLNWLKYDYLLTKDRIMFLLTSEDDKLIGHYGITHATPDGVNFDNGLRGTTEGCKGFMTFAEIAMLSYAFDTLGVPKVILYILSNNKPVMLWHDRSGYTRTGEVPLKYVPTPNGHEYVTTTSDEGCGVNYIQLTNTPKSFVTKVPWAQTQYDWRNKI